MKKFLSRYPWLGVVLFIAVLGIIYFSFPRLTLAIGYLCTYGIYAFLAFVFILSIIVNFTEKRKKKD
jgi:uncharacterized membrane protein